MLTPRNLRSLLVVLLLPTAALGQRVGYGLEMSGVFGRDAFFTSGLGCSSMISLRRNERALYVLASAEVGRKEFKNLIGSYRTLVAWRAGLGYLATVRNPRFILGLGPYMAYCSHNHRDTRDPDQELRWTRPYMQLGLLISWTRLVDRAGRFGLELRGTPAIMGLVGDAETARTDVPPGARWVLPLLAGVTVQLGTRSAAGNLKNANMTTAAHRKHVPSR